MSPYAFTRTWSGNAGSRLLLDILIVEIVQVVGIIVFGMSQIVLIVDFEFFRRFGSLIRLSHGNLVFIGMFIIPIVVIIPGTGRLGVQG
jgi:hypothetical protein